ncbi:MAG: hypothetical protein Q9212_007555, partial [Teloschistes hypoglaucus]
MATEFLKKPGSVTNQIVLLGAILTLANLAQIIHRSSRVFLFQQAQCLIYYKLADPSKIDAQFQVDEALCKLGPIQSRLSMIDGVDAFLTCLPQIHFRRKKEDFVGLRCINHGASVLIPSIINLALLVLATYKELLARVGLRRLVILGLCFSALEVLYTMASFWFHRDWATPAALLSFLFALIGGGGVVRTIIIVKCIADIAPPES